MRWPGAHRPPRTGAARCAVSHRSAAASPVAASVAAPATPMRNGVGRIGSVPPVNATVSARSADQPATGRIERKASCGMVVTSPVHGSMGENGAHRGCVAISPSRTVEQAGEHARKHDDTVQSQRGSARPAAGSRRRLCTPDRGRRLPRHLGGRFARPRPADTRSAGRARHARRRDPAGRTGHRRAAVAVASPDRACAPRAVGAGAVGQPPGARRRQRLDQGRLRPARLRLRRRGSAPCGPRSASCAAPGAASPPTPAARYRPGRAARAGRRS